VCASSCSYHQEALLPLPSHDGVGCYDSPVITEFATIHSVLLLRCLVLRSDMWIALCEVVVFVITTRASSRYVPSDRVLANTALLFTSAAVGFAAFTTEWMLTGVGSRWIASQLLVRQRLHRYFAAGRALVWRRLHRSSSTLPLLSNTIDIIFRHKSRLYDWMVEQTRESGGKPWIISVIGRPPALIVTSIEACEDVLRTQFKTFDRVDHGILGTNSGTSEQQCRAVARFFSTKTLREDVNVVIMEKTERVCTLLAIYAANDRAVSMNGLLPKFSTDVFVMIAFGVDLHRLGAMNCGDGSAVKAKHPPVEGLNVS
jgi:hypothetical protein